MQGCIAMWAVNWLLSPAVLQVLPLLLWATLGAIVSTQDLLCNMLITFLDRFLQLSPAFTCHIEHQCSKFFLNSFFCMSCFWQLSIKGIYVDHLYWHYSSASVSCPVMDCCRVDDCHHCPWSLAFLQAEWIPVPSIDSLYISISPPQPSGMWASTRSLPTSGHSAVAATPQWPDDDSVYGPCLWSVHAICLTKWSCLSWIMLESW